MGLLAAPLVLLYLLRQKRPDMPISSTLLWSKTLADMRASTPFQKLRRNLLLFLQLFILAALVLALMRPVIQATAGTTEAGVIVIDATASMQTKDGGGTSRLDRAKEEARKLVDRMRPGDRYTLIVDGGGLNHSGIDFTTSKSELLAEIEKIEASDTSSDLSESLLLAATKLRGIGSSAEQDKKEGVKAGKVWLLSDGSGVRLPDVMGEANDLLQFVKIGESDHSVGITRLSVTAVPKEPKTYQVFVGIRNAWSAERKIGVMLAFGDKDHLMTGQGKFVTIPANGEGSCVFERVVTEPGRLYVRLDETDDDFLLDNTAYVVIEPERKPRVVAITPGNELLERFLRTDQRLGYLTGAMYAPEAYRQDLPADLVILDGLVVPENKMPRVDTLMIRPRVTGPGVVGGFKITAEVENPALLRWKRDDPVMRAVDLSELHMSNALLIEKDAEMVELASAPESPLIAYKDVNGVRRYIVAFSPLTESDWWRGQYSLPLFLQNIVEQTRIRHFIGLSQLIASGTPAKLWDIGGHDGNEPVTVHTPDGGAVKLIPKDGTAEFANTDKAGFYEVVSGEKHSQFAVNLLSSTESDIRPRALQASSGSNVEGDATVTVQNKEVWPWVAIAALVVLLIEWWVYHRRWA